MRWRLPRGYDGSCGSRMTMPPPSERRVLGMTDEDLGKEDDKESILYDTHRHDGGG
jgi:hypothetical protein